MASKHPGLSSLPKSSISSPVIQAAQQPKSKSPPPLPPSSPPPSSISLKDLQDALDKTVQKTAELLEHKNNELREDIVFALQGLANYVEKVSDRVEDVADNLEILENRVGKIEDDVDIAQNEIIMSEYRIMEFALRIRGLKENPKECLKEEIAAELAPILEWDPKVLQTEIEKIFRVNSWVARQRNLPRDVVVYFARRSLRNDIIQAFYRQRFQIAAQDVIILKEIPSKILRKRRDFAFLVDELKKRQIQFRWDVPVGIVVTYDGVRHRLNSISKARDFYLNVLKVGSPPSPSFKRNGNKLESQLVVGAMPLLGEEILVESVQQSMQMREDPCEQRMTRAAYKRRDRQQQQQQQQQQQRVDAGAVLQSTLEPVGGTRPKRSSTANLDVLFQRLKPARDGKASNLEC